MLPGMEMGVQTAGATGGGGGLSVSASPNPCEKAAGTTTGAKAVTTPSCVSSVMGGQAPFTYAWARIAGDSAITAQTPAAASTTFGANLDPDTIKEATFRLTVTDATLVTATVDVPVSLQLVNLGSL